MELTLTHFRLLVKDYRDCFKFYTETLGFHVAWGNENTGYCELKSGGVRLALFERAEMADVLSTKALPVEPRCQDRLTVVFRVNSVDKTCSRLRSKGVEFVTDPVDRPEWRIRTAHFRDPSGNLIEINQRLV
ncbi:MAG: VOC family protein [Acidobacteriota bacterium]|nr:MAG: VOC family protein [Acidobacteriota bacterium]